MKKYRTVGIISPSIMLRECEQIEIYQGIAHLERWGLRVKVVPSVYKGMCQYEGSAQDKAKDIMSMFADDEVDILLAVHGGAGALRILEHLDYDFIATHPKPIIGFSDSTSLQLGVYAKTGNSFVAGYLPEYEFRTPEGIHPLVESGLVDVLTGKHFNVQSGKKIHGGVAEGILLGECLSTISDLSGTPYYPDIAGSILLLEDECESSYKISLMLSQLKYNPQFKDVKGIVLGRFSECVDHPTQGSMADILADFAAQVNIPMISDFNFGHFRERYVLPAGVKYHLDADNCILRQLEDL